MTNCFEPHSSACYNFIKDSGNKVCDKVTVIITPTTIVNIDDDTELGKERDEFRKTTLVKWSCSLGRSCSFFDCIYSRSKTEFTKR
jgi:hypothetical protein